MSFEPTSDHTSSLDSRVVAIFCSSFPPESGGAAGRIFNLAVLLRNAGYQVQVVCAMPNYPTGKIFRSYRRKLISNEIIEGIHVKRVWVLASNSSAAFSRGLSMMSFVFSLRTFAYRRILRQSPALIIVSSPPLPMATDVVRYFRKHNRTILLNVSDLWPLSASALGAVTESSLYRLLQKQEAEMYGRADAFTAQSEETLAHIKEVDPVSKPVLLYRNLPSAHPSAIISHLPGRRIIYPGVLGHAQGLLDLCSKIDFNALGVALHIYGEGPELPLIQAYISAHPACNVSLHKPVSADELMAILPEYRAMLIPLIAEINGAVPSKLFTAIYAGLPVLYSGGNEGSGLVKKHSLGWVAPPGDYQAIADNIRTMTLMNDTDYSTMRTQIIQTGNTVFNKTEQDKTMVRFIENLIVEYKNMPAD